MRAVMFEQVFRFDHMIQAVLLNALLLMAGAGVFLKAFNSARRRGLLLRIGE
jgi:hypothetical protein